MSSQLLPQVRLRIARSELDRVLIELTEASFEAARSSTRLAYGHIICTSDTGAMSEWIAGRLHVGSLQRRPAHDPLNSPDTARVALLLLTLLPAPASLGDCDSLRQWLGRYASAYRLATVLSNPRVLVVSLTAPNADEANSIHAFELCGPEEARAVRVDFVLPGADMQRGVVSSGVKAVPVADSDADTDERAGDERRYSRLAGALGVRALERIQSSNFAFIGVGRTGSTVAHSAARLGASLTLIDADYVELHNCDGDLSPLHEGLSKVDATQRFVRELTRPGTRIDARRLSVRDIAVAGVIDRADVIISAVDNPEARRAASAWALALLKPHLDIGVAVRETGAEADLRLVPPGMGCIECVGGAADIGHSPRVTPSGMGFRAERLGSLRSFNVAAGHLGLRMLEQLYAGTLRNAVFRRISEDSDGGLSTRDLVFGQGTSECAVCNGLFGAGAAAAARYIESRP